MAKKAKTKKGSFPPVAPGEVIIKLDKSKRPKYYLVLGHRDLASTCEQAIEAQRDKVVLDKQLELKPHHFQRGFVQKIGKRQYEKIMSLRSGGAMEATFYFPISQT